MVSRDIRGMSALSMRKKVEMGKDRIYRHRREVASTATVTTVASMAIGPSIAIKRSARGVATKLTRRKRKILCVHKIVTQRILLWSP